jgi:hypothetical protein
MNEKTIKKLRDRNIDDDYVGHKSIKRNKAVRIPGDNGELGTVVHACNPSYLGDGDRMITV